jgi:hypothetical protein
MKGAISYNTRPNTCNFKPYWVVVWTLERPIRDISKNGFAVAIAGVKILERKHFCVKTNSEPSGINVTKRFPNVCLSNETGEPRVFLGTDIVDVSDIRCRY